jgi:hypothetical protein
MLIIRVGIDITNSWNMFGVLIDYSIIDYSQGGSVANTVF